MCVVARAKCKKERKKKKMRNNNNNQSMIINVLPINSAIICSLVEPGHVRHIYMHYYYYGEHCTPCHAPFDCMNNNLYNEHLILAIKLFVNCFIYLTECKFVVSPDQKLALNSFGRCVSN